MKRLVVFGDSYSCVPSEGYPPLDTTWHFQLARHFNLEYKNFAHSGTSLEWSLQQYLTYAESEYEEGDCILFVQTTPERFWFSDMETLWDGNIGSNKKNNWRKKNEKLIEYLVMNTPSEVFNRSRLSTAMSLKGCSHNHPWVLVLDAADDRRHLDLKQKIHKNTDSFFYPDWNIGQISKKEYSSIDEWKKNMAQETTRSNHLNLDSHKEVLRRVVKMVEERGV